MNNIKIIGAGTAGYGAASKLKEHNINFEWFERKSYYGGHATSFYFDEGYVFDDGPHISFTKNERIKALFADNAQHEIEEFTANVNNYWKGQWVKHPAQVNLFGLPPDLNSQILQEMIELDKNDKKDISNYQEWLYASFGKTFADNFPMKYTRKYHTTEAVNMSTDWLGPRLYRPKLEEVIYGMLSPTTKDVHYVTDFRYPTHNGFKTFLTGIEHLSDIHYDHELKGIQLNKKQLVFNNGLQTNYDHLISSLPLNIIIEMIDGAPKDVIDAAKKLAITQCVVVNVGVNKEKISENHWTYIYDEDFNITRLSIPSLFSKNNAPKGCSSIQAELYFSEKYKPLSKSPEEFIESTISELMQLGLIESQRDVVFKNSWLIPYAQVIYDHDRKDAVSLIHRFLKDNNIHPCGRYGDWSYAWTDESFESGEKAAEMIKSS